MRIELPREAQRFGANLFHGVQKVYELDAGPSGDSLPYEQHFVIRQVPYELLHGIEQQMAIVVPMKSERLRLLEGVLFAIPHPCLVIVVSNSPREPVDRFNMELGAIENFQTFTKKQILVVHQRDPLLGEAFAAGGYPEILDESGLIRHGKAEGMILGTMLARLAGRKYIGFIDADNYIPGAVHEYIREYATGFALSKSDYTMVRTLWHSKPKVVGSSLYFAKYGRSSIVTNEYLNRLISYSSGFETEVIKTGNSGEHAMSLDLAMLLDYAPGYAVETYHFINLLEKFGGIEPSPYPRVMKSGVEVYQIESRNPHLHESKGEKHVQQMIHDSLRVIHQSVVCPERLKREIVHDLVRRKILPKGEAMVPVQTYPSLDRVALAKFAQGMGAHPGSEWICEESLSSQDEGGGPSLATHNREGEVAGPQSRQAGTTPS
jgi:mannosyl-3-phosphoglycerate synthase